MLDDGSRIMARAYSELSTCRSGGFSVGPIPWMAMVHWCEYHRLEPDVADHLIAVIREVDAVTLRRERSKAKNQNPKRR